MLEVNVESRLDGENLAFYTNIEYLKELTAHARALLSRSNAVYKDMLQVDDFKERLTAAEHEEEAQSYQTIRGECRTCGLEHGAKGFCIVDLIMKEEAMMDKKDRVKKVSVHETSVEHEERPRELLLPKYDEYDGKVEGWEELIDQKMTADQLYNEYNRICRLYGFRNAQKFLYARSLARKPSDVYCEKKMLKEAKEFKLASDSAFMKSECVPPKEEASSPFLQSSKELFKKMAIVAEFTPPHNLSGWKNRTMWKDRIKSQRNVKFAEERLEPSKKSLYSSTGLPSAKSSSILKCSCNKPECPICGIRFKHLSSTPSRRITLSFDHQNYHLDSIKEKLKGKRQEKAHPSYDSAMKPGKDTDIMLKNARDLNLKDLKSRLASAVGPNTDDTFDKQVVRLSDLTFPFQRQDSRDWGQWDEQYREQKEAEDEALSGDSDISTGDEDSSRSTTEQEFPECKPRGSSIPFVEETLKLTDSLFGKINAAFEKSILKNQLNSRLLPYRPVFSSACLNKMLLWKYGRQKGATGFDKLNPTYWNVIKPRKCRQTSKMKRLKAKNKRLSKTQKRRRRIEAIQIGKRFKLVRRSIDFSISGQYKGFKAAERELLQNPVTKRFAAYASIEQDERNIYSKANVHHHYRLLRNLFDDRSQSEECLMDQGMKDRLAKFRQKLGSSFQNRREDEFLEDFTRGRSVSRLIKTEQTWLTGTAQDGLKSEEYLCGNVRKDYDTSKLLEKQKAMTSEDKSRRREIGGSKTSKPSILCRVADQSQSMMDTANSREYSLGSKALCRLPIPPLSESDSEESDLSVEHKIPGKEEARMQQSARSYFPEKGPEQIAPGSSIKSRSYFPNERYSQDSLTDGSSDSYVPTLLQLPSRNGNQNRAQGRAQKSRRKPGARWKKSSESTSSDELAGHDVSKERSAWNRRCRRSELPNVSKPNHYSSRADKFQRAQSQKAREKHFVGNQTAPEFPQSLYDRSHSKNEYVHISHSSLPRPPSDTIQKHLSTVQFRSASSNATFLNDNFRRPVITERLLKGGRRLTDQSQKQSVSSRNTVESARPILTSGSLRHPVSGPKVVSVSTAVDVSVIEPIQCEPENCETPKSETQRRASRMSFTQGGETSSLSPHSMPALAESKHNLTRFVQRTRQISDAFRRRSVIDDTQAPSSRRLIAKSVTLRNRMEEGVSQADASICSISRKLQKMEMIGPTKRKCFNLDIGQGINCVRYLKENAPGADEFKRKELADLLTSPIEERKTKQDRDPSASSSTIGRNTPGTPQKSASTVYVANSRRIKPQDMTVYDEHPLANMHFKNLDEIFKEVHGINRQNTPERYIDNEYEYESRKKQQLKRHKI